MAGPEINVGANVEGAEQAIKRLTDQINTMGQAASQANHTKFQLVSPDQLGDAKRLSDLWSQISRTQRGLRTAVAASGQKSDDLFGIDFNKIALTHTQQRSLVSRFLQGTSAYEGQFERPNRPATPSSVPRPIPRVGALIDKFGEGMGGLPGRVINGGMRGGMRGMSAAGEAAGGAEAGEGMLGGMLGGALGFATGGLAAAGVMGLFKAGSAVSHGYSSAKSENLTLDSLKMNMANLNASFSSLQEAAALASHGLLINSNEAAQLFKEFNSLSGGVKDASDLMGSTRTAVGLSNAFGDNDRQTVSFFARERQMQGGGEGYMRRFSMMVGEAIVRSGLVSQSDRVMQAIEGYTSRTTSESLTRANVSSYAGMFSALQNSGLQGLTPGVDASMLQQANSAVSNMGAAGEGGQAFSLAAYDRQGTVNPIQAQILSEGGLFGTRRQMFGDKSPWMHYMRAQGYGDKQLAAMQHRLIGKHGDETNMQSLMEEMDSMHASPLIKASMVQRLFGFHSINQAMAFASVKPENMGEIHSLLKRNGITSNEVNASGIKTLARISTAHSMSDLHPIIESMQKRKMLNDSDLTKAEKGGVDSTKNYLAKIAAKADREQTTGSQMLAVQTTISTKMTSLGQKLLTPMMGMEAGIMKMAGFNSYKSLDDYQVHLRNQQIKESFKPNLDRLRVTQQQFMDQESGKAGAGDLNKHFESVRKARAALLKKRDAAMAKADALIRGQSTARQQMADLAESGSAPGSTPRSTPGSTPRSTPRSTPGSGARNVSAIVVSGSDSTPTPAPGTRSTHSSNTTKKTVIHHHSHSMDFTFRTPQGHELHTPASIVIGPSLPSAAGE